MSFSDTWNAIQSGVTPGMTIPNWTVHNDEIGEPFRITDVTSTAVVVNAPGATSAQRVSHADFAVVYERWDDYTRKAMLRSDFSPLTRHSKYVISILHWLESQNNGSLPQHPVTWPTLSRLLRSADVSESSVCRAEVIGRRDEDL